MPGCTPACDERLDSGLLRKARLEAEAFTSPRPQDFPFCCPLALSLPLSPGPWSLVPSSAPFTPELFSLSPVPLRPCAPDSPSSLRHGGQQDDERLVAVEPGGADDNGFADVHGK